MSHKSAGLRKQIGTGRRTWASPFITSCRSRGRLLAAAQQVHLHSSAAGKADRFLNNSILQKMKTLSALTINVMWCQHSWISVLPTVTQVFLLISCWNLWAEAYRASLLECRLPSVIQLKQVKPILESWASQQINAARHTFDTQANTELLKALVRNCRGPLWS